MRPKLEVGRTYKNQTRVEEWMTAHKAGNTGVDVLSTPMLLQFVEEAAVQCIGPTLEAGEITLGSHAEISHLAPTPVGFIVRVEVEVLASDGRRIEFTFSAFDEREKIAEGTHERYVVALSEFKERIEEKES